jgi:hypothetical protein
VLRAIEGPGTNATRGSPATAGVGCTDGPRGERWNDGDARRALPRGHRGGAAPGTATGRTEHHYVQRSSSSLRTAHNRADPERPGPSAVLLVEKGARSRRNDAGTRPEVVQRAGHGSHGSAGRERFTISHGRTRRRRAGAPRVPAHESPRFYRPAFHLRVLLTLMSALAGPPGRSAGVVPMTIGGERRRCRRRHAGCGVPRCVKARFRTSA